MKKLMTFLLFISAVFGYTQSLDWVVGFGGIEHEQVVSTVLDQDGNIYATGTFHETVDFDPSAETFNLTALGNSDSFISMFDNEGHFEWVKQIGGADANAYVEEITQDDENNIILVGSFENTVDFDPGPETFALSSPGQYNIFVLKLDNEGEFLWAKQWGGSLTDYYNRGNALAVGNGGVLFVGGSFVGTCDFDPGEEVYTVSAQGNGDAFISKLNSDGEFLWVVTVGSDSPVVEMLTSIDVDEAGNILSTGQYHGTADFDPGAGTYELYNEGAFYYKLSDDGNFIWAKSTEGIDVFGNCIKLDADGNTYITGKFYGTSDFDPSPDADFNLTSIGYDIFLLKLNTEGDFEWANNFGGDNPGSLPDMGESLALNSQGLLYVTGTYFGPGDFNPGPEEFILTPVGFVDMFLSTFTTDGDFVNAITFGSIPEDYNGGLSVVTDELGNLYVSGYFSETTDFDPGPGEFNLISQGWQDAFLMKMDGIILGLPDRTQADISVYPNPTSGNFTISLDKIYSDISIRIYDMFGQIISEEAVHLSQLVENKINAPSGVYFVEVTTEANRNTIVLVKR